MYIIFVLWMLFQKLIFHIEHKSEAVIRNFLFIIQLLLIHFVNHFYSFNKIVLISKLTSLVSFDFRKHFRDMIGKHYYK
jgi:hypothetical protein